MPANHTLTGHCLCGAVHITAHVSDTKAGACHCNMCQRWAGGPFIGVQCAADSVFKSNDALTVYDSSPWAERGFCKHCGSPLFYRLKESGEYHIPVGVLDRHEGLTFETEIFIDSKPSLYTFADNTRKMTRAEVMKMFGIE